MDVIDLLNKEKINFTVSGQDFQIKCLNPDHDDTNPSLRIDKVNGVMHCFSCGFRGNIFTHFYAPPTEKTIQLHRLRAKIEKVRSENVGLKIPEFVDVNTVPPPAKAPPPSPPPSSFCKIADSCH